jgi:beta-galactosidase GanA
MAPIYMGTAYYPEQWEEANWEEDIRLMKEAGVKVARMGEFAWSNLEPSQG